MCLTSDSRVTCTFTLKERIEILVMNGFRSRLVKFMEGRYGADELFYLLVIIYALLALINAFAHSWTIYIIGTAVFIYAIFRSMSRNVNKRYRENMKFLSVVEKVKGSFSRKKSRAKQNGSYYFKRCPNCGKMLRLPRVKGKHGTKCPACGCEFKVNILRGAKRS